MAGAGQKFLVDPQLRPLGDIFHPLQRSIRTALSAAGREPHRLRRLHDRPFRHDRIVESRRQAGAGIRGRGVHRPPFAAIFTPEDVAQKPARAGTGTREDDGALGRQADASPQGRQPLSGRWRRDGDSGRSRQCHGLLKVMHDVSAQHRASEALRQSEERYRLLVENVRDYAIFLLDPDGASRAGRRRPNGSRDIPPKRLSGSTSGSFSPPRIGVAAARAGAPHRGGRGTLGRRRLACSKGWVPFWGDEIVAPIREESGHLRGFAKIVRDLTDRQRAALEREQLYAKPRKPTVSRMNSWAPYHTSSARR